MIEKEHFVNIADSLFIATYQEKKGELVLYIQEREKFIDSLYDDSLFIKRVTDLPLGMAKGVESIPEWITAVTAFFVFVKDLCIGLRKKQKTKLSENDLKYFREKWRNDLLEANLDSTTASLLVENFTNEIQLAIIANDKS